MKRILCAMLTAAMIFSLCSCGSEAPAAEKPSADAEEAAAEVPAAAETAANENDGWAKLKALDKVFSEDGKEYTLVTMPAEFSEGATQEILDSSAGVTYTSAVLNDDGSVTYRLTEKQFEDMFSGMKQLIDEGLQELVDNEEYAFTNIEHNADYTLYDVSLSTDEIGMNESFMTLAFYMYSGLYSVFTGGAPENVKVNFYNPAGQLITPENAAS